MLSVCCGFAALHAGAACHSPARASAPERITSNQQCGVLGDRCNLTGHTAPSWGWLRFASGSSTPRIPHRPVGRRLSTSQLPRSSRHDLRRPNGTTSCVSRPLVVAMLYSQPPASACIACARAASSPYSPSSGPVPQPPPRCIFAALRESPAEGIGPPHPTARAPARVYCHAPPQTDREILVSSSPHSRSSVSGRLLSAPYSSGMTAGAYPTRY